MDALFDTLCHRSPARCLDGLAFICARCLGLYLGAIVGALAVAGLRIARARPHARSLPWVLSAAILATPLEVVLEWLRLTPGSNAVRSGLALLTGTALVLWMGTAMRREGRPLPAWISALPWLLDALAFGVIMHLGARWLAPPVALGMGVLVSFALAAVGLALRPRRT